MKAKGVAMLCDVKQPGTQILLAGLRASNLQPPARFTTVRSLDGWIGHVEMSGDVWSGYSGLESMFEDPDLRIQRSG